MKQFEINSNINFIIDDSKDFDDSKDNLSSPIKVIKLESPSVKQSGG